MNGKILACWVAVAPMILDGCAANGGANRSGGQPTPTAAATPTEQSLMEGLNAERRKAGKTELPIASTLAGLARGQSDGAAALGQLPGDNVTELRKRSGFGTVGKLQGIVKDRGPESGAGFVGYWVKGEHPMLLDDWSKMGVGVSRSADGRLFAVVLLGGYGGGGSLMEPGIAPGGFMSR